MPGDLLVTPAAKTDLPDLVRLHGEVQDLHACLSPDLFRADYESAALETFWTQRLDDPAITVVVATLDGGIIGCISFELQDRPQTTLYLPRRRIYVHHLVVGELAQGKGAGAALLDYAEAEARSLGISDVLLDSWAANAKAQAFFKARGYGPLNVVLGKTMQAE